MPTCIFSSGTVTAHAEGLAEPMPPITVSCSGGVAGSAHSLTLFVSLNAAITNRLDANSQLTGLTVSGASVGSISFNAPGTLTFNSVAYTAAATPTTITIGGIVAAVAPLATGSTPTIVTASFAGAGALFSGGQTATLAIAQPSLLSSLVNRCVPCNGSPLPATLDFPTFAATSISSELRVTEGIPTAFSPVVPAADTGVRILVNVTGYGTGANVYVPDAIVGNDGTTPTTAGAYATSVNGGTYTPGSGQLLLIRVNGADATGAGGTLAISKPASATSFTSVTQIPLTNGSGSVVYEVVDANPAVQESAHIPVFLAVAQTSCPNGLTTNLSAELAPVSSVATATMTDPIPRFVATVPALDCTVFNDCNSAYFPNFVVPTTPISFSGASLGNPQSTFVAVGNSGSGLLNFTSSIVYPAGTSMGWLSLSPSSGTNGASIQVIANPATLTPGTYTANVTISAGAYGSGTIPVTFTVGAVGVTVQNVGNAASFQYGTVAPGSYAVLYGLNLVSGTQNPTVTFNGIIAQLVYTSATQINLIVPSTLAGQQAAAVVVTAGTGLVSNTFKVTLATNAPGVFNPGIINVADGSVNSATHPASRGSYVSIYLTGLANPVSNVTVNIGTQTGIVPQFAGAQPTLPALDQVNVLVPTSLAATPNPVPVQVCVPEATGQPSCSNQINMYIQ